MHLAPVGIRQKRNIILKYVFSLDILGLDINCFDIFSQHKKQDMFVRSVHSKAFFNVESKNLLIACLHMFV